MNSCTYLVSKVIGLLTIPIEQLRTLNLYMKVMKVQSWYIGMLTMFTCSRGTQLRFILCKQHCWPSQPSYAHQTQKSHFPAPLWLLSGCHAVEEPGNKATWPTRTEQYAAYAVPSSQWWFVTKYMTVNSTVCYQMCFVVLLFCCYCCCWHERFYLFLS